VADRRAVRTRAALERSFNEIFLTEGFEKVTPGRVAEAAEVGRSTFYEHFSGREELLEKRLLRVLQPLGQAVRSEAVPEGLEPILDHFWTNRLIVRSLLAGRPREVTMRALTALIEEQFPRRRTTSAVPTRLIAAQIAGRHRCSTSNLARALAASARAIAGALGADPAQDPVWTLRAPSA
jgi:AcrR family transcriptional regulator